MKGANKHVVDNKPLDLLLTSLLTIDLVDLYLIANVRVFIDRLDGLAFNKRGVPARHRLYPVEQFLQQQPSGEKHQTHIDVGKNN